jgi:hypothetical protein
MWWSLRATEPVRESRIISVRGACLAARRMLRYLEGKQYERAETAISLAERWVSNQSRGIKSDREKSPGEIEEDLSTKQMSVGHPRIWYSLWSAILCEKAAILVDKPTGCMTTVSAMNAAAAAEAAVNIGTDGRLAAMERSVQRQDLYRLLEESEN